MGDPEASTRYRNETNLSSPDANPLVPQCSVAYLALLLLKEPQSGEKYCSSFCLRKRLEDFAVALTVAESFLEPSNCEHHAILSKAHHLCKIE